MINQQNVKNVILDLGGVLLDIEPDKTISAFKRICNPEVVNQFCEEETPEVVVAMEKGLWDKKQFLQFFQSRCKPSVIEEEIVDSWCAMIQEFPHERVEMVKQLSRNYNVYLLSNTNVLHVKYFEKEFKNRYHFSLHKLFTKHYYSSDIGFRKPEKECYEYVLKDAGILASETIMVDDREDNCLAAEMAGMQSLKVPENSGIEAVIGTLLNCSVRV
jgi:glucose-1-phosphatase